MILLRKYLHISSILVLILISKNNIAQTFDKHLFSNIQITESDSSKLFFEVESNTFIRNNEFFGDIVKGYTLLGFNLKPMLLYYPNSKIKLTTGINVLFYYSMDTLHVPLIFSFQYKLTPKLDFILGTINGTVNHKLIDPLFDFERYLYNQVENGVQFLWNGNKFTADLWLDWEFQIFQDDPFQEKFNVGLSSLFNIVKNEKYSLSIPFQNLFRHEGGQINDCKKPMATIYNNAIGLSFRRKINTKLFNSIRISSYWLNYFDLSPTKQQKFDSGNGYYGMLEVFNKSFDILFGYWYGHNWIAPIGNPMFESCSRTNFFVKKPYRATISNKISYKKEVSKGIYLGLRFDSYFDLYEKDYEYSWSFLVNFDGKFLLNRR